MSEEGPVDAEVEGPSEPVTTEMITKGINKIDIDTTAGSSSIVAEICEARKGISDVGKMPDIILEGCISIDLHECYIVNLYIGKLDALNRGNSMG